MLDQAVRARKFQILFVAMLINFTALNCVSLAESFVLASVSKVSKSSVHLKVLASENTGFDEDDFEKGSKIKIIGESSELMGKVKSVQQDGNETIFKIGAKPNSKLVAGEPVKFALLPSKDEAITTEMQKTGEKKRDSWFIGFNFEPSGESRMNGHRPFGVDSTKNSGSGFQFGVGGTLNQYLLLGGGIQGFQVQTEADLGSGIKLKGSYTYSLAGPELYYFPFGSGLYLKGGIYLANLAARAEIGYFVESHSISGYGYGAETGYAFWLGDHFNLVAEANYNEQKYKPGEFLTIRKSDFWTAGLGFYWF